MVTPTVQIRSSNDIKNMDAIIPPIDRTKNGPEISDLQRRPAFTPEKRVDSRARGSCGFGIACPSKAKPAGLVDQDLRNKRVSRHLLGALKGLTKSGDMRAYYKTAQVSCRIPN